MDNILAQQAYTQNVEPSLSVLKDLFGFLIDQPLIILGFGFIISAVVIKEALYRNGNGVFSSSGAGIIALVISFFAASIVATNLQSLGTTIGYIVVFGLPLAVLGGLIFMRNNRGQRNE